MRTPQSWWIIASAATVLGVYAAASPPQTNVVIPGSAERSCDGRPLVQVDTTIDSQDTLLKALRPRGRTAPQYPVDMRSAGIAGRVVASFVIDTLGRVPSGGAWIHDETGPSFGNAVCDYLKSARFTPLVVDGRRLSVRVQRWPVSFDVR